MGAGPGCVCMYGDTQVSIIHVLRPERYDSVRFPPEVSEFRVQSSPVSGGFHFETCLSGVSGVGAVLDVSRHGGRWRRVKRNPFVQENLTKLHPRVDGRCSLASSKSFTNGVYSTDFVKLSIAVSILSSNIAWRQLFRVFAPLVDGRAQPYHVVCDVVRTRNALRSRLSLCRMACFLGDRKPLRARILSDHPCG